MIPAFFTSIEKEIPDIEAPEVTGISCWRDGWREDVVGRGDVDGQDGIYRGSIGIYRDLYGFIVDL